MLNWANRFNICSFLDNHHYSSNYPGVECLVAVGAAQVFNPTENILDELSSFCKQQNDWLFGHINYDLKNSIEPYILPIPTILGSLIFFSFSPKLFYSCRITGLLFLH